MHGSRRYQPVPETNAAPTDESPETSVDLPWIGRIGISNGATYGRDPNTGANLKPFGEAYENSSIVSHGLAMPGQVDLGNMHP
ncbi:hypothetical protein AA21291_1972 [Swaminathania salitolerans LMG 21291]|uniref:Uncharacterized protein n=1 Tax=Swaminathania salitolerans TaxID=182838 RepID=A0A511BQJ0_9PROT|nr:hypothetical protein AA21291_1972 [Swaminathania salitolerans LMG 21291]GEL01904.1 hypothetical protein SSA02_10670 [Swaminathania salitolerans]